MALILMNGAGGSAADPILNGLGINHIIAPGSMDVADVNDTGIDTATGFPITNSHLVSLAPAESVIERGVSGSYNDTTKQLTIGSTVGLATNNYIYVDHGSITAGVYRIATIPDGTNITFIANPFDGGGNQTGISYQVCWYYPGVTGTAPSVSDASGTENFYKADLDDGATSTQQEDTNFIRNAPAAASYIAIAGASYTGQTISDISPTLSILSGWANNGGVSHVELSGTGAFWNAGLTDQTEKTLALAESGGLFLSAGDGTKTFNIILKSATGGVNLTVACDLTLDTAGPNVIQSVAGR